MSEATTEADDSNNANTHLHCGAAARRRPVGTAQQVQVQLQAAVFGQLVPGFEGTFRGWGDLGQAFVPSRALRLETHRDGLRFTQTERQHQPAP